jgi:hypothetical protein
VIESRCRTPQVEPAYQGEQNGRIGKHRLGSDVVPKLGGTGTLSFAYHALPQSPHNPICASGWPWRCIFDNKSLEPSTRPGSTFQFIHIYSATLSRI